MKTRYDEMLREMQGMEGGGIDELERQVREKEKIVEEWRVRKEEISRRLEKVV